MKPPYWLFAAFLPALALQASVLPLLKLWGGDVDLILVLTVLAGLMAGPGTGAAAGFWGGLLSDLVLGRFLGMGALVGMILGYLSGLIGIRMFRDHFLVPPLTAAGAALLQGVLTWGLLRAFGLEVDPWGIVRISLSEAFLAAVVIVPLASWFLKFRPAQSDFPTPRF